MPTGRIERSLVDPSGGQLKEELTGPSGGQVGARAGKRQSLTGQKPHSAYARRFEGWRAAGRVGASAGSHGVRGVPQPSVNPEPSTTPTPEALKSSHSCSQSFTQRNLEHSHESRVETPNRLLSKVARGPGIRRYELDPTSEISERSSQPSTFTCVCVCLLESWVGDPGGHDRSAPPSC